MKNTFSTALLGAALLVGAVPAAFAQDAEPTAPAKLERSQIKARFIKIKNVPSALVAYQLDPKHNPRPISLGADNVLRFGETSQTEAKGAFDLPGDIEQIVSVDPQNVLLIAGGSDEDIRRLQELIDVLDQPLRQVEIEAQFVEISPEDAKVLGIDFSQMRGTVTEETPPPKAALKVQLGFVRNNFTARLNALIADNKAKIIASPRVTAINNLSATVGVNVDIGPLTDGKRVFTFRSVGANLKLTPTINGDDTVTLMLDASGKSAPKLGVTSIVNLRDGNTIAVAGLSPLFAPVGAIDSPNIIAFVTARILRRTGADVKLIIPGK